MLVVLKIPIVYLAVVVWWAIRSEPRPDDEPRQGDAVTPLAPCGWDERRERRARRPAGRRPLRPSPRPSQRTRMGASS